MKVPSIVVQLVHIDGPYKGRIDEFTDEVITIGRDPRCHLAFPPDMNVISRRHAEIRREGNRFKIIDFSTNGTFIRGEAIEETYLKNGDVIVFSEEGPKVSFLTMVKEAEQDTEETLDRPATAREPVSPAVPGPEKPSVTPSATPSVPPVEVSPVVSFTIQYGPSIHTFKQASLKIGSDQRCDFILQEPGIAAFHVEVFYQNGHYWIKDLSGEARALLNDRPLVNPTVLRYGDLVTLVRGGTVFEYMGDGKLSQKMLAPGQPSAVQSQQPPQVPPVQPSAPAVPPAPTPRRQPEPPGPQVPPARPGTKKVKPSVPPSIPTPQPRKGPSRFSIPMWVWVALGSAAIVAVIVYFVAQWASR